MVLGGFRSSHVLVTTNNKQKTLKLIILGDLDQLLKIQP